MSNKKAKTELTKNSKIEELELPNSILITFKSRGWTTIADICKQERKTLWESIYIETEFNDMLTCLHAKGFLLDSETILYGDVINQLQAGEKINFLHFRLPVKQIFLLEKFFGNLDNMILLTEDSIRATFKDDKSVDEIIFLFKYVGLEFATKEKPKANINNYLKKFVPLISARTCSILIKEKIYTLGQLLEHKKTDLIKISQFGETALIDVLTFVNGLGYSLKAELEQKPQTLEGQIPLSTPIESLQHCFSSRTYNCLVRGDIHTIGDLASKRPADLLIIRNLGQSSLKEIEIFLEKTGYSLNYSLRDEVKRTVYRGLDSSERTETESTIHLSLENIKDKPFTEIKPQLSVRAFNILMRANIRTFGELISKSISEISKLRDMNTATLNEIVGFVHSLGLTFADENKNIEVHDNETEILQAKINEQIQGNGAISNKIEEKRKLLQRYQELIQQRNALIEEEKALDSEIAQVLQTLSHSVVEQSIQKTKQA